MAAGIRERVYGGETVIPMSESLVLVASKSEFGVWHAVERLNGRLHCDCHGFTFRGKCRHLAAFREAQGETEERPAVVAHLSGEEVLALLNGK